MSQLVFEASETKNEIIIKIHKSILLIRFLFQPYVFCLSFDRLFVVYCIITFHKVTNALSDELILRTRL